MSFALLEAEAKARLGRVLNEKWTLDELIGVGGMAAVYRARHRNGARAAVKILHPALAKHQQVRERFLREGYAANQVEHRGAVQVLDDDIVKGGEDDGAAYLVMELLEGESLEERAARAPPVSEQEFLTIANGVLSVLEAAHAHGVVHRDLKPENIFLARDPEDGHLRVKVLDFGLACLIDAQRTTGLGLALGTPSYMSPEQAAGRSDEIDGRTDIFALGATGFRILAQRRIHDEADAVRLVGRMANEPAPPIRTVKDSVSEAVAMIIDRAIAFRREDRYQNAAAMRADVQAAREVELASSTRVLAVAPVTDREVEPRAPDPPAEAEPDESTYDPVPRRRRRSIMPFVTLALFGGIGVAYVRMRPADVADATTVDTATPVVSATPAVSASVMSTLSSAPEVDAEADAASEPDAGDDDQDADADTVALPPPPPPSVLPSAVASVSAIPRPPPPIAWPAGPMPAPHPTVAPKRPARPAPAKRPPAPTHTAPRKR